MRNVDRRKQIDVAPWGFGSDVTTLPTACAVGYKYFVGFANWLTGTSKSPGSNRAL
jgi:hypothetical protein